jgi:hypothetical protein
MKTLTEQETQAILSMAEAMKALDQQLADAKKRIEQLEGIVLKQKEMIKELQ